MALRPRGKGLLVRGCEFPAPLTSQEHFFFLPLFPPPPYGGSLMLYIFLSLVHPPPTLVSHSCPYLSVHPIGYSFWRSVTCYGPHHIVQGSCPRKWGQGVRYGYLIWRWQLLLGLLFYHAPMTDLLGSKSPLGSSRGLPLATWRLPLLWFWSAEDRVALGSISWQSGFPSFVLGHFFLLSIGLGLDMKWAGVSRPFGPTIAPQNHAAWLLRQGGGFWCSRTYIMAGWVLFPYGRQGLFAYQGTLLAFWRTRCIVINAFMGWCRSLRCMECVFNGAFMKRCRFGGWGFPWELNEIYFAWHSLFELCAQWTPQDFVLYISCPRRTIFHKY